MLTTLLQLDHDQIHLWLVLLDKVPNEKLMGYRTLLSPEEQRRQDRFSFEIDRRRHLVTRALVRSVLSRYVAVEPQQWEFSANSFGRPTIANGDARTQRMSFNISHTKSLVLLGVGCGRTLGVDAEDYRGQQPSVDLADCFLTAAEAADLRSLPNAQQCERLFEYWTLKEAYLKARGTGLSTPPTQISFRFPPNQRLSVSMHPQLNDRPSRWGFWQFRPAAGHVAAICVECNQRAVPRLIVRGSVPLAQEELLQNDDLRAVLL